jgi:lipoprotein-anchoring transpeptidase ErfK/SrfK
MGVSRRDFLKAGLLTLSSLAFRPYFTRQEEREAGLVVRISTAKTDIYREPDFESDIVGTRYLDQLITVYYTLNAPKGPAHNPRWYRIWGGYLHSNHTQIVATRFNPVMWKIPEGGQISELTVPFSQAYKYDNDKKLWVRDDPVYYETTHWITDIVLGPDGQPWYQVTSELDRYKKIYIPAIHLRAIPDEEISPLSNDVPPEKKHVEVDLQTQTFMAFENGEEIFRTKVSTGIPTKDVIPKGMRTPDGWFNITSKYPSKHMGAMDASGAPGFYSLPGVPWSSFYQYEYGAAFHGTYWHNNFGAPMSHGCINMKNQDAKWFFRWITPTWEIPAIDRTKWDRRGSGTAVWIYTRRDTSIKPGT